MVFVVLISRMKTESEGDVSAYMVVCAVVRGVGDRSEDRVGSVGNGGVGGVECGIGFVVGDIETVYAG